MVLVRSRSGVGWFATLPSVTEGGAAGDAVGRGGTGGGTLEKVCNRITVAAVLAAVTGGLGMRASRGGLSH